MPTTQDTQAAGAAEEKHVFWREDAEQFCIHPAGKRPMFRGWERLYTHAQALALSYTAPTAAIASAAPSFLTYEQWYDLAQRHATRDWNADGYLDSVKALCRDFASTATAPSAPDSAAPSSLSAEPVPNWFPYLVDRVDGCKGHYGIARRDPNKNHPEFIGPRGDWVGYGAAVFSLKTACAELRDRLTPPAHDESELLSALKGLLPLATEGCIGGPDAVALINAASTAIRNAESGGTPAQAPAIQAPETNDMAVRVWLTRDPTTGEVLRADGPPAIQAPEAVARPAWSVTQAEQNAMSADQWEAWKAALKAESEPAKLWCEKCEGTGKVYQEHQAGCWVGGEHQCPDCDGNGYWTRSTAHAAREVSHGSDALSKARATLAAVTEALKDGDTLGASLRLTDLEKQIDRIATPSAAVSAAEPVAWQVRRTDGSPLACWETCTKDLYDLTLLNGRYCGFENGPPCEVRALGVIATPTSPAPAPATQDKGLNHG